MNFKLIALMFLAICSALLPAGCTSVESKGPDEVYLDGKAAPPNGEIRITDADVKKSKLTAAAANRDRTGVTKQTLSDNSVIETSVDGTGNKTDRRVFANHVRIRMVVLRTSIEGVQEATLYGFGTDTVTLYDLGDRALTASADELADAAGFKTTRTQTDTPGFMRKENRLPPDQPKSAPLQPLPSSQFQQPPAPQPVEPVRPETPTDDTPPTEAQPKTPEEN